MSSNNAEWDFHLLLLVTGENTGSSCDEGINKAKESFYKI
jgi:hypothetical protein